MSDLTLTLPVDFDLKDVGRPSRIDAKLTRRKRLKFFHELAKDFNVSRSANAVGVNRKAIYLLIERDEKFSRAFQEVKDLWLDCAESSMLVLASQPTREGFNDRKLALQAHRRETYGNNPETQINIQVNTVEATDELHNILTKIPTNQKALNEK
jgi:hypothetical protein